MTLLSDRMYHGIPPPRNRPLLIYEQIGVLDKLPYYQSVDGEHEEGGEMMGPGDVVVQGADIHL